MLKTGKLFSSSKIILNAFITLKYLFLILQTIQDNGSKIKYSAPGDLESNWNNNHNNPGSRKW